MNLTPNLEGKQRELSGVCSALWATRDHESMADDDIDAYGAPSECRGLAYAGIARHRISIIKDWGWTPATLRAELGRRVSAKWIYHFLSHVL